MGMLTRCQGGKAVVCLTPKELYLGWDTLILPHGSEVSCPLTAALYHQPKETGISTWEFLHPKTGWMDEGCQRRTDGAGTRQGQGRGWAEGCRAWELQTGDGPYLEARDVVHSRLWRENTGIPFTHGVAQLCLTEKHQLPQPGLG